jgi:uncharacterized repeat protein (TIGR01451 family)
MPTEGVVLTDDVPDEVSFMSSNPPGQVTGRTVQWQIGRLGPGERRVVEVNLRAERQGSINPCAEAVAASGLRAKNCVTTAISLAVPPAVSTPGATCVGPAGAAPRLDVKIAGPDRAYVGDAVTFEIVITNLGTTTANGIVIKDRYDPGLAHATAPSPIKRLLGEDLPPGQSKRIGVELRAVLAGRHCQNVEITGNGGIVANAESCITVMDRPGTAPPPTSSAPTTPGLPAPSSTPGAAGRVSVKITGPKSASVGEEIDFFIDMSNDGSKPLTDVKVHGDFDLALEPIGAKPAVAGYEGDLVYWTFSSFSPGQKTTIQVRCKCEKSSLRACLRTKVTAPEIQPVQQEACVEIRAAATAPAPTGLSMTVSALHEPVAVGKELTYVIQVTNTGKTEDSQVALTVRVPEEMIPALLGTYGPTQWDVRQKTIEFRPVDRIRPGEPLTYRVRVQAKTAGDVRLKAELTSRNQRQAVLAEARTTIIPGQ